MSHISPAGKCSCAADIRANAHGYITDLCSSDPKSIQICGPILYLCVSSAPTCCMVEILSPRSIGHSTWSVCGSLIQNCRNSVPPYRRHAHVHNVDCQLCRRIYLNGFPFTLLTACYRIYFYKYLQNCTFLQLESMGDVQLYDIELHVYTFGIYVIMHSKQGANRLSALQTSQDSFFCFIFNRKHDIPASGITMLQMIYFDESPLEPTVEIIDRKPICSWESDCTIVL